MKSDRITMNYTTKMYFQNIPSRWSWNCAIHGYSRSQSHKLYNCWITLVGLHDWNLMSNDLHNLMIMSSSWLHYSQLSAPYHYTIFAIHKLPLCHYPPKLVQYNNDIIIIILTPFISTSLATLLILIVKKMFAVKLGRRKLMKAAKRSLNHQLCSEGMVVTRQYCITKGKVGCAEGKRKDRFKYWVEGERRQLDRVNTKSWGWGGSTLS